MHASADVAFLHIWTWTSDSCPVTSFSATYILNRCIVHNKVLRKLYAQRSKKSLLRIKNLQIAWAHIIKRIMLVHVFHEPMSKSLLTKEDHDDKSILLWSKDSKKQKMKILYHSVSPITKEIYIFVSPLNTHTYTWSNNQPPSDS